MVVRGKNPVEKWKIEFYQSLSGNPLVYDWFLQQEPKVKAKFAQIFDFSILLIQENGLSYCMDFKKRLRKLPSKKLS
jgi:hypothetical protein